jgi:hypothetical protein
MGTSDLYVRYEDGFPVGCMTAYEWAKRRGCSVKAVRESSAPSAKARADRSRCGRAYYERVDTSGRVPAMLPEDAVRAMSHVSGVSLGKASERMGRSRQNLDHMLCMADRTRARGSRKSCGLRAETLALAARAMGFRLALVGHGTVIEVVPGRRSADD